MNLGSLRAFMAEQERQKQEWRARLSGIDDRSIIAILVSAIRTLASKVSETAHLVIDTLTAHRVQTQQLCVDDVSVARDQFAEVFGNQPAAAGAPSAGYAKEAPSGSSAPLETEKNADTATITTPSDAQPSAANDNEADALETEPCSVEGEVSPGAHPASLGLIPPLAPPTD